MSESNSFSHQCHFCYANSQEKSFLMRSLYRRFKRQLRALQSISPSNWSKCEGNNFKQLIKILFPSLLRELDQCEHLTYANSFCNNLQIDHQLFAFLCQRLSNSIAQTNYHLSLIVAQIKNVSDSLATRKIQHEEDKNESSESLAQRKKRNVKGGKKRMRGESMKSIGQRQQQANINSLDVHEGVELIPLVHSQLSIESNFQQNVNHFSYYFTYPIFFHTNSDLQ